MSLNTDTSIAPDSYVPVTCVPVTEVSYAPVTFIPSNIMVQIINQQIQKENDANIWENSIYKDIAKLEANNVGNVGENMLQQICENQQIESSIDGTKTKQTVNKEGAGDGKIKNKTVEVKTARLGASQNSFQHELGEHPWKSDYIVFVDVSPKCIYLSIFPNFTEEHYKAGLKCEPYFPTKKITRRKGEGNFKLDTSPVINDDLIIKGYCIKILENTTFDEIGTFINNNITG